MGWSPRAAGRFRWILHVSLVRSLASDGGGGVATTAAAAKPAKPTVNVAATTPALAPSAALPRKDPGTPRHAASCQLLVSFR